MRLTALMAATLLDGLFHPVPKTAATQVYGLGEWRLTVVKDTFTGQTHCRLENHQGMHPDIVGIADGLAFRFGRTVDTSDAWYKLDGQPARPWHPQRSELKSSGSLADAERLDNPSNGEVTLPAQELRGIRVVTIRPTSSAATRIFNLGRMSFLLSSSKELGCKFTDGGTQNDIRRAESLSK